MKRLVLVFLLAAGVVWAASPSPEVIRVPEPLIMTGLEELPVPDTYPESVSRPVPNPLDDYTPGSEVDTIGWSWFDYQTNSTHGKQIAVDGLGYTHAVWTKGFEIGNTNRHVYYNIWDPDSGRFIYPQGVQVDASSRAGFVNVVAGAEGSGYPIFHQVAQSGDPAHAVGAMDFLPGSGAFTTTEIPYPGSRQIIWPHAAMDIEGEIQVAATENGGGTDDWYARGTPTWDGDGFGIEIEWPNEFAFSDSSFFPTIDIAASWHTGKVAMAWLNDSIPGIPAGMTGTNVFVKISQDRGETWGDPINITDYELIDTTCLDLIGDIPVCNKDTLRPWIDLSVFIDDNDVVHVAFSTSSYYYWGADSSVGPWTLTARPSMIFHWDEFHWNYSRVADGWYGHNFESAAFGVNQLVCHRPNLAQDTVTGYLYCSYQKHDSVQYAENNHPMADAWVTVSTDGGMTWSEGTNVSNTDGGEGLPAPLSRYERDITIASFITDGWVHMQYMMDHDAGSGSSTQPIGVNTNNELIYQRIPVEDIPTTPLLPNYPLHYDSMGFNVGVGDVPVELPETFTLYQNYPNPFNPSTKIQFDLTRAGDVSLRVYDITGREAAVILANETLNAGAHVVEFDGSNLPSGVYFYRMQAEGQQLTHKMMLIK